MTLFKSLADLDRLRVLVCGGDGTAGWVMEEIRRLYGPPSQCHVPLGILPLVRVFRLENYRSIDDDNETPNDHHYYCLFFFVISIGNWK